MGYAPQDAGPQSTPAQTLASSILAMSINLESGSSEPWISLEAGKLGVGMHIADAMAAVFDVGYHLASIGQEPNQANAEKYSYFPRAARQVETETKGDGLDHVESILLAGYCKCRAGR